MSTKVDKNQVQFICLNSQGTANATLIKLPNGKNMLIDCNANSDEAVAMTAEHLIDEAATKIDYIVISHYHYDHVGGLIGLAQNPSLNFENAIIYLPQEPAWGSSIVTGDSGIRSWFDRCNEVIAQKNMTMIRPSENQKFTVGDLGEELEFINTNHDAYYFPVPIPGKPAPPHYNNCSLCCYFNFGMHSILFTGDCSLSAQDFLSKNARNVTGYQLPHHAYDRYFDPDHLLALSPRFAFIMNGNIDDSRDRMKRYSIGVRNLQNHHIPYYASCENGGSVRFAISQYDYCVDAKETKIQTGLKTYNAIAEVMNYPHNTDAGQLSWDDVFELMDDNSVLSCCVSSSLKLYEPFVNYFGGATIALQMRKICSASSTGSYDPRSLSRGTFIASLSNPGAGDPNLGILMGAITYNSSGTNPGDTRNWRMHLSPMRENWWAKYETGTATSNSSGLFALNKVSQLGNFLEAKDGKIVVKEGGSYRIQIHSYFSSSNNTASRYCLELRDQSNTCRARVAGQNTNGSVVADSCCNIRNLEKGWILSLVNAYGQIAVTNAEVSIEYLSPISSSFKQMLEVTKSV